MNRGNLSKAKGELLASQETRASAQLTCKRSELGLVN